MASHPISASHPIPEGTWLSLTDLGRLHGISAVQCGRLLEVAGVRERDGAPSRHALRAGLARRPAGRRRPGGEMWHRRGCGAVLEDQGLPTAAERRLVDLWADLLEALQANREAVLADAEELASELPGELVEPVNAALRQRGCGFQLQPTAQASRSASAC